MAAPVKRREIQQKVTRDNDEDRVSSSSENEEYEIADEQGMELQVDFEGRNPQDPDFHGIKTLLQQLFLKAHIDLAGLTELIIRQNYVGSVIKQSDNVDEIDDVDEDDDVNDVFGITTVINLSNGQNIQCIQHLRDLLLQLADEHATDAVNTMIKSILKKEDRGAEVLGLLINERFVNIPAKISVPLFENLISEIKRAKNREMPFKFTHYILICKLYKSEDKKVGKQRKHKNKNVSSEPSIWSNPEEEIFAEEATASFEFSVEEEADTGLSGTWTETDDNMVPYRRVLLFEASKLESIFEKIRNQFS